MHTKKNLFIIRKRLFAWAKFLLLLKTQGNFDTTQKIVCCCHHKHTSPRVSVYKNCMISIFVDKNFSFTYNDTPNLFDYYFFIDLVYGMVS